MDPASKIPMAGTGSPLPVDGGNAIPTGTGEAMRAEGFSAALPVIMQNGRVVFGAVKDERVKLYDIRIARGGGG
jgi:hypothetical protein